MLKESLDKNDVCEIEEVHEDILKKVSSVLLPFDTILRLAEIFKVLGEPTRMRIIDALSHNELCVCDLADLLGMSSSAISHHLRVLRNTRLVKYRKDGKSVIYSLDDEHIVQLFQQGLEHVEHS